MSGVKWCNPLHCLLRYEGIESRWGCSPFLFKGSTNEFFVDWLSFQITTRSKAMFRTVYSTFIPRINDCTIRTALSWLEQMPRVCSSTRGMSWVSVGCYSPPTWLPALHMPVANVSNATIWASRSENSTAGDGSLKRLINPSMYIFIGVSVSSPIRRRWV